VNATETVKVRLFVLIGEVRQGERYTLKKVEGVWLISGHYIQDDRVIGRTVYDLTLWVALRLGGPLKSCDREATRVS
jgi:hypothetical protein